MKQFETHAKTIGEYTFHIRPMPAFKAAKVSGELVSFVTPLIGSIIPAIEKNGESIANMEVDTILPALVDGAASLDGTKMESLLKMLIIDGGLIAFEDGNEESPKKLNEDLANEIFCGSVQDMVALAAEVVKINFGGVLSTFANKYIPSEKTAEA